MMVACFYCCCVGGTVSFRTIGGYIIGVDGILFPCVCPTGGSDEADGRMTGPGTGVIVVLVAFYFVN
jgi:hypothetical protein